LSSASRYFRGQGGWAKANWLPSQSAATPTDQDAGLLSKTFTTTDCDLIFTMVKAKGAKRIGFSEFEEAIIKIAGRKGCSYEEVEEAICGAGGPTMTNATVAGERQRPSTAPVELPGFGP
jgi:hypothetical protein